MTPQQRADEIFNKFYSITCNALDAKECSLYFVDEVLKSLSFCKECGDSVKRWWKDVRKIIERK